MKTENHLTPTQCGTPLRKACEALQPLPVRWWSHIAAAALLLAVFFAGIPARAMEGSDGIFDPSRIIKIGSTYHCYGDGQGITHKTSTDLVTWTTASTVFGSGNGPSWIQTYVPGFKGYFWAPDIIQMGSKYFLYYACSLGAAASAIGVATSTDGNNWTDQGMVVYSTSSTAYGSIDPGMFQDASGNYWLCWGSHLNGIWDAQLNASTGKLLNSTKYNIVNINDAEASYMLYHNGYYYVFYNCGSCCSGTSSTYYISVGRSTSPSGGFTGNRTFITGSNPCYGPGHFGYLNDGGTEYCSYHYWDPNSIPRLAVSALGWTSDNWPYMSPDWIPNGAVCQVQSVNNGLSWDDWGCNGANGLALAQSTYSGLTCQKWVFHQLGWGVYEITCQNGGTAVDCVYCGTGNGTMIDTWSWLNNSCQQWKVYRDNANGFVFATMNGGGNDTRVIDQPGGNDTTGAQQDLWDYNGGNNQKWYIWTGK